MNFQRFQPYFIYFTLYFILLLYIYRLLLAAPNRNFGAFYKKCSNLTGDIKVPARKMPAWSPGAPPPPSYVKLTYGGRGSGGTRRPVTSSTEQHPSRTELGIVPYIGKFAKVSVSALEEIIFTFPLNKKMQNKFEFFCCTKLGTRTFQTRGKTIHRNAGVRRSSLLRNSTGVSVFSLGVVFINVSGLKIYRFCLRLFAMVTSWCRKSCQT